MIQILTVGSPAVATGFSLPRRPKSYRLLALTFVLTTDVNAANRLIELGLFPIGESAAPLRFGDATPITASLAALISFFPGGIGFKTSLIDLGCFNAPLPNDGLYVGPDHVVAISVTNIQAGDQLNKIVAQIDDLKIGDK